MNKYCWVKLYTTMVLNINFCVLSLNRMPLLLIGPLMGFIFYGKLGEISTNVKDDQELAVVCLHLLQTCMAYINTLILQEVL